jgi:uncharacterized membrane-anchored protein
MSLQQHDPNAEIAFVQQALAAAEKSERNSRITVAVLAVLAAGVFVWMHLHMFPESLAGLMHSILRVDLFFGVVLFAITVYLRQEMNRNTRTILRALANTRSS